MFKVKLRNKIFESSSIDGLETILTRRYDSAKGATTYRIVRKPDGIDACNTIKIDSCAFIDNSLYIGGLSSVEVCQIINDAYTNGKIDLTNLLCQAKYVVSPRQIPERGIYYGSVVNLDKSNILGFLGDEVVTIDGGNKPRVTNPFGSDPFADDSDDEDEDEYEYEDWDEEETEID
jgi:hypothetical protein